MKSVFTPLLSASQPKTAPKRHQNRRQKRCQKQTRKTRLGGNLPLKNHGKRVSMFTMCANIEPKSEPRWPNPNPDAQILAIKEMFQTNFQNTIKINGSSAQDLAKKLKPNKIKKSSKNIQKLSQHASWNYDFSQAQIPKFAFW